MNKYATQISRATVIAILSFAPTAQAADPPPAGKWKIEISTGIGATQAAYSDNWTGGEAGSIIWASDFWGQAQRQLTASWYSGNELRLAFGQTHSQNKTTKDWSKPQKSADKIRFDTILKLTRGWAVDPYTAGTFESQIVDASGADLRYVNPVDLTETAGVARTLIKHGDSKVLVSRLGAGFRQRLAKFDDPADPTRTLSETTNDGGLEWVTDLQLGSAKSKYSFASKLTVFQALFNSKSDEFVTDDWKTADLNWDNILRARVNSLLQVGLAWQLLYDKQIAQAGRFKETLALGIAYNFANFQKEKKK